MDQTDMPEWDIAAIPIQSSHLCSLSLSLSPLPLISIYQLVLKLSGKSWWRRFLREYENLRSSRHNFGEVDPRQKVEDGAGGSTREDGVGEVKDQWDCIDWSCRIGVVRIYIYTHVHEYTTRWQAGRGQMNGNENLGSFPTFVSFKQIGVRIVQSSHTYFPATSSNPSTLFY